jgi:hypothetical protein
MNNHVIPHDILQKLKEAQNREFGAIKAEVTSELNYVSQKFKEELKNNIEKLIANPFNIYLKVPRISKNNEQLYLNELRKQYSHLFQHDMQISEGYFIIMVSHGELICNGDPRPKQLMVENAKLEDVIPDEVNTIFNDAEKKKFESELELGKRPSVRSGFSGEKKDMLVPLFLQRRNSRLSLPTISARKAKEVSVSDNQEDSVV